MDNKSGGTQDFDIAAIIDLKQNGGEILDAVMKFAIPLKFIPQLKSLWTIIKEPVLPSSEYRPKGVDLSYCKKDVVAWNLNDQRVLVIVGGSGIGKSMFAQSLGEYPLLINSREGFKFRQVHHTHAIFDDCSMFAEMKPEEIIQFFSIPQHRTTQPARYQDIQLARMPIVITSNVLPFFNPLVKCDDYMFKTVKADDHQAAIERRMLLFVCRENFKFYDLPAFDLELDLDLT